MKRAQIHDLVMYLDFFFGLTCFSLGYNLGKDNNKTQK